MRNSVSSPGSGDKFRQHRTPIYLIAVAALASYTLAFAKDKENSEVKFTSRTELVLIPALVTDKAGTHITGLKKEDFKVLENGSERQISSFEEITSDPHRLSRRTNPDEFSNAVTGSGTTRRVTLIVLDLLNTAFTDQAYAHKELLKYLSQSVDRREPTGLYKLDHSGLHIVHDFTTDPGVLIAALHKVRGDSTQIVDTPEDMEALTGTATPEGSAGLGDAGGASGGKPGSAAAMASAIQREADRLQTMIEDSALNFQSFQQRLAITYTLEAMQQLAQSLTGFPGRKSLIWAGGGFPFSVSDNTMQLAPAGRDSLTDVLPMYERTWQLLNDAQIALYPLDVKGLTSNNPSASIGVPNNPRHPGAFTRSMNWRQLDTQATFETFAAATGGRPYYNSNDLARGFREAVHDSEQYYMLGYYLDRSNTKSGWRKLAVKVKREHVEVRARTGFFVTNATVNPDVTRDSDLVAALKSPLDYTALSLVARWDPIQVIQPGGEKEVGKKSIRFIVNVAPDASLIDAADNNHVALDFVALARTPTGQQVDRPTGKKVDLHLTAEQLPFVNQKGIGYRGAIE
ncbi:MAG: VWA domain-containing protein, partial [Terriglobales bacterium]